MVYIVVATGVCGSWISNSTTGDVHGYIVLTSISLGMTYVLLLRDAFTGIASKFPDSVVRLPTPLQAIFQGPLPPSRSMPTEEEGRRALPRASEPPLETQATARPDLF